MKYRIKKRGDYFTVEKKEFLGWTGFDVTEVWDRWYSKKRPYLFKTIEEAEKFIFSQIEIITREYKI